MSGSAVIGALRVNLALDSAAFQNGIRQAQADAGRFGAALKSGIAVAAAGAAAALVGLAAAVKGDIDVFDDMSKAASKIGVPIDRLSELKYAADLSGVSMEGLQTALGRLSRNMNDFHDGSKGAVQLFDQLGVSATNADGTMKPVMQVLSEVSDVFASMPDGAQKTALAMQLMGRSGADMIPLLNGGSVALSDLMAEAARFGLTISESTGKAAEAFNDNLSRIGYIVDGVSMSLSAALAPVLAVVSDGLVVLAQSLVDTLQYLPQLAEAIAVVAGSLAIAFSPAILASVGALIVSIGSGMVGAVQLLTAAMLANPLGAFAVAVAAAITAVYYFRNEIGQALGVDVVQIVKDAANLVIGSFVAAFEDIRFVWSNFPAIIGAAVVGAANLVISVVNDMVNGAKMAVNDLISAINVIPGVNLGALDTSGSTVGKIANPFAEQLSGAVQQRNAAVKDALSADYIGAIGKAFEAATPPAQNFGNAVAGVNRELAAADKGGSSGGGKSPAESYADIIDKANRRIASLKAEQQAIGMTEESAAALRYETELLNQAQQRNIALTAGQKGELAGLAQSMASIEAATDKMRDALDFAKDATKGFLSDFRQGLANGESVWQSFGNAALNVLNKIVDKIETQLVDALFSANGALSGVGSGSGGGGLLGGLFAGLGKLFGFASGGTILPGGAGGIDSQLVMFRKSPNERVDITKPGQTLSSGGGGVADVRVFMDDNGNWQAKVERISDGRVARAAPAILGQANSQVMPTVARYQNDKAGAEWR